MKESYHPIPVGDRKSTAAQRTLQRVTVRRVIPNCSRRATEVVLLLEHGYEYAHTDGIEIGVLRNRFARPNVANRGQLMRATTLYVIFSIRLEQDGPDEEDHRRL